MLTDLRNVNFGTCYMFQECICTSTTSAKTEKIIW